MADMLADGGLGGQFPLEQWFFEMPICTRIWTTATVVISILVQCQLVGPLHLFYSVRSVFIKNQVCFDGLVHNSSSLLTSTLVLAPCNYILLFRSPLT